MFIEDVDEFGGGDVGVVAVQDVEVEVVGLEAVEGFEELLSDGLGVAVGCVAAFAEDDDLIADAAAADPLAEKSNMPAAWAKVC